MTTDEKNIIENNETLIAAVHFRISRVFLIY